MVSGSARIIRGNALALPLADASVDLICTSPPFFGLRSYQDNGQHYAGQIGSEATPAEFIDALIAATREMVRVLKSSGSIFLNLGDKYSGAQAQNFGGQSRAGDSAKVWRQTDPRRTGIPNKSLMLLPERYRIACVDRLGLIARAVIVWNKPNGLPESVTDRVRRSHEDWVHLTKQPRYYSAVDEIREETTRGGMTWDQRLARGDATRQGEQNGSFGDGMAPNPLGKLPGSVWTIPTQPLTVPPELGIDHFAAFPMEWPRRIIQGWSPAGVCVVCGEGRRPVADRASILEPGRRTKALGSFFDAGNVSHHPGNDPESASGLHTVTSRAITGYACGCGTLDMAGHLSGGSPVGTGHAQCGFKSPPACTCPATRPAVILDPFGGTGTTALIAKALGRTGISVDMSADYCRLAEWRCNDPGQMAAALQVEKPDPVSPDQLDLFSEVLA